MVLNTFLLNPYVDVKCPLIGKCCLEHFKFIFWTLVSFLNFEKIDAHRGRQREIDLKNVSIAVQ